MRFQRALLFSCLQTSCVLAVAGQGGENSSAALRLRRLGKAAGARSRSRPSSSCPPFSFQLLRMFFRQQDEIRRLKDELSQKDIRIRQLQLELKNLRNSPKNN